MWQLPKLTPEEILIYLRKSRTDDPALSVQEVLSKHEQMLDEWVERNLPGLGQVPEVNRFREVVSGETIDSRPRVQELLRQIESPRYKAVLIVEPQRLSRGDLEDIGRLVKLFRYSNTIVITLQYTYDLRDSRDRDDFERELKRGNEFLEYQKRIMNNGRLLSVENGNYLGTYAPYGYRKITIKEGKRKCHTLEPVPEEAAIVRKIFEWTAQGWSSHKVAKHLNDLGIPSPRGSEWSPESMKKIRTNEHYIGKVIWNRRKGVKTVEDGEIVESRPVASEYLVFPGKHEPIIDMELWDAVQEIRAKIPPVPKRKKCANAMAGLLFCECGRVMYRQTYSRLGKKAGPPRLLCPKQNVCGNASIIEEEMLAEVAKVLRETIADFEIKLQDSAGSQVEQHRQLVAGLEKRLDELDKLELSQWDKYTQEGMPKHIFEQLNEKVLKEKAETQQALCTAKDTLPEPVDYENKLHTFREALEALENPDAPALEKNLLLKKCIDKIEYSRPRKKGTNRRWGEPEPFTLDIHLRV